MRQIAVALAPAASVAWAPVAQRSVDPYQVKTVCTSVPITIGRRSTAAGSGEPQPALDAAASGDAMLLAPGAFCAPTVPEGSILLRNRPIAEGQWVAVRSAHAAFDGSTQLNSPFELSARP